jgi:hypothetical protein
VAVAVGQLHNLGTCPFKLSPLEPVSTGTAQTRRAELKLSAWAIVVSCHTAHMARVWCKVEIKCLYHTEK